MSSLDRALEDCLNRLASGEAGVEECLARYPEQAEALRRMLAAAGYVERARNVYASPVFKARSRARLVEYMEANPRRSNQNAPGRTMPQFYLSFGRIFNFASGMAAVLLLVLMTGTVLAQMALPGDALYSWRLASERAWRLIHPNPLQADLTLSHRHARDLRSVVGNKRAEQLARRDYQRSLAALSAYTNSSAQQTISDSLKEQRANLTQAQVEVPELDRLLDLVSTRETHLALKHEAAAVEEGRMTYRLTVTNQGPAGPVTARVINTLSPAETFEAVENGTCTPLAEDGVTCTVEDLAVNASLTLTLTTTIDRCYVGEITNSAVVTGTDRVRNINPDNRIVAEEIIRPSFPAEAQVIYVQSSDQAHNLGLVASSGRPAELDAPVRSAAPAWSPTGAQIAFFGEEGISELGGTYSQGNGVWVIDVVNGRTQNPRLLVSQDHVRNIAWSPNGRWLAFEVGPPEMSHEVRIVEAQTGQLVDSFPGEQPAWRPDSQKLVIKSCAPDCGLWQVNLDGSGGEQITFGDTDSYPAWSPMGDSLAFASARDGNWEIYILSRENGQLRRLTHRPGTDTTPVFGPCGRSVYLRTDHYGSWWITVMKPDGSDERQVREGVGASDDWGLARPAIK